MFEKFKAVFIKHAATSYQAIFLLTIGLGLFFAVPSILFGTEKDNADTGIGVENSVDLGSIKVTILKRGYNEKDQYAEIFFKTDGQLPDGGKLEMLATDVKSETSVEHKLIRLSDNYYLIQLPKLPEKWVTLAMDIGVVSPKSPTLEVKSIDDLFESFGKKNEDLDEETVQGVIFMNKKKVPEDEHAKAANQDDYLRECLQIQIEESQKLIKENRVLIRKSKKLISGIEDDIRMLEREKEYQTKSEVNKTQNEIDQKKSRIGEYKQKIETAESSNTELKEKISKINKQISDGVKE